eukprot:jgi/Botrbrau1/22915/Bobra.0065s0064.1
MPWQRLLMSQPPVPGSRYTRTYICEVWHFERCSSPVIAVVEESPYWNWETVKFLRNLGVMPRGIIWLSSLFFVCHGVADTAGII